MSSMPGLRGRDSELDVIGETLMQARVGRGAVVLVEGRGGFGKTRFLNGAASMARCAGIRVGSGTIDSGE
jgi:tRNA A37 threonylcarbamoyladenosine biosynthesis protein TsaE